FLAAVRGVARERLALLLGDFEPVLGLGHGDLVLGLGALLLQLAALLGHVLGVVGAGQGLARLAQVFLRLLADLGQVLGAFLARLGHVLGRFLLRLGAAGTQAQGDHRRERALHDGRHGVVLLGGNAAPRRARSAGPVL